MDKETFDKIGQIFVAASKAIDLTSTIEAFRKENKELKDKNKKLENIIVLKNKEIDALYSHVRLLSNDTKCVCPKCNGCGGFEYGCSEAGECLFDECDICKGKGYITKEQKGEFLKINENKEVIPF